MFTPKTKTKSLMKFFDHSELSGSHAFLSASKYHWLNYDEEKLLKVFENSRAAQLGTELHALASEHIRLGVPMPDTDDSICKFVNDALDYGMSSEVVLFYSYYCYGTADAISFDGELLRIHDLKTGTGKTSMSQLEIYAALFCLEYDMAPDMAIQLRIYQNNSVTTHVPDADRIQSIMKKIVAFNSLLEGHTK